MNRMKPSYKLYLLVTAACYFPTLGWSYGKSRPYEEGTWVKELRPTETPALWEQPELVPGVKAGPEFVPWLTGPLLTPSAHVIPPGHFNFEPYVFITNNNGVYDNKWHRHSASDFLSVNNQMLLQIGLFECTDFFIVPQFFYNHIDDASKTSFGDLPVGFDFQLLQDDSVHWYPAIKLQIREIFPTGKYERLDPRKKRTDAVGGGSYQTALSLTLSRLFHFRKHHFLAARFNFTYNVAASVHVKGFNAYGGAANTSGKAYPGSSYSAFLGFEYTLTQRWVLALDALYTHTNKNRFSGNPGESAPGIKAVVTAPSSEQFILAPALEYNWNANVGLIAGPWFTVAGRNTTAFAGGVIALNYYH